MGRKNKNVVVTEVQIVDLGAKGKAVGKKDSAVFFVEGALKWTEEPEKAYLSLGFGVLSFLGCGVIC